MTSNAPHRFTAGALCLLLALPLSAAPARAADNDSALTLEQIMADPDWIGNPPQNAYWSDDGRAVYYERQREGIGNQRMDLYRVDLATGKAVLIEPARRVKEDARGELSRDRKRKVYERHGDVFVKDLKTGAVRQLTRTAEDENGPRFLADNRRVTYRSGDDVFVYDLETGLTSQPARLVLDKDPADKDEPTPLQDQQTRFFDVIRQKQEKEKKEREEDLALRKEDPTRVPQTWYLGKDVIIDRASLSPSGDWLLVVTAPKWSEDSKRAKLPQWVTESGNIEVREVRPKVGIDKPVPHSVILLDLVKHERHDLDFAALPGSKDDPLKALREAAKARKEAMKKKGEEKKDEAVIEPKAEGEAKPEEAKTEEKKTEEKKEEPAQLRTLEVSDFSWSDDGQRLAVQLRARDNKDRWIATFDTATAKLTPRHRLTDAAWINWDFNEMGWLPDNETLWFLSEEGGYSRLYALSERTGEIRPLTPEGQYEVSRLVPGQDGKHLYYIANREHPGKYDVWRVEVATARAERLTSFGGLVSPPVLSPDESQILVSASSINRPDELFVQPNRPGAQARQVTRTQSELFLAQDWTMPEIVPIPSTHGAGPIYSRVYTPRDFDPSRTYPAVMFVHGAGYLQNIHYGWSNYFREFMFHTLLTRQGYVVIDMDYRASAGYGRDWRTAIYRQMGTPELEDFQDGVAWLVKNKNVDPKRVGVYGGSYGGFMTYMALFRQPDLFAAGAALRPVSDWAHYNEEYTSNILNRPEVDPEAYEKSSPIEYAAGLQKPLLICAPMLDQNVFFQDNVRLVQKLIELKKENFEMAVYPVEDHSFVQPTSWLDEYRRIYKLFETYVK
ncbi:MAG TPA: prolyl oligopeptidase family serine peptidase [Thermoanaerobaculia bacterium]